MLRTSALLAALALAGCDAALPDNGPAYDFAERMTGGWSLAVVGTEIAPDGRTTPLYGGPLTGGSLTVVVGLLDEDTLFRTFHLTPGAGWSARGFRPAVTSGGLFADGLAERVVFLGANADGTDVAGTLEVNEADRQVWAFVTFFADETARRDVWTLTR